MERVKLGIAVVYLVAENDQLILELHLRQIKQNTKVPYQIYASVNRLLPLYQNYLAKQPEVKICKIPDTKLRRNKEHTYYLQSLVEAAIADGCTHVVTLHVDSFPVRADWVETLVDSVSAKCPLATIAQKGYLIQYTAGLFFLSDFYLKYQPRLLLTKAEKRSKINRCFLAECTHQPHDSGVGFIFKAYANGLSWIALDIGNHIDPEGDGSVSHDFGKIHGDLIFHLTGAIRFSNLGSMKKSTRLNFLDKDFIKPFMPKWLKRHFHKSNIMRVNQSIYPEVRKQFLADPDRYIEKIRSWNP